MKNNNSLPPRIFVNSLPKSGTHLLCSILEVMADYKYQKPVLARNLKQHSFNLLPSKERCLVGIGQPQYIKLRTLDILIGRLQPGHYLMGHIPYQDSVISLLNSNHLKTFFVVRDPRDVIVSQIPYYLKHPSHYLHQPYKSMGSEKARLIAAICGIRENDKTLTHGIAEKLDIALGWLTAQNVLTVSFEKLIGERGGGELETQIETVTTIGRHINLNLSPKEAQSIGAQAFGQGYTFHKGQIGRWHDLFDDEIKDVFKQEAGHHLIQMGYENSNEW